jgi:hypothetical protein
METIDRRPLQTSALQYRKRSMLRQPREWICFDVSASSQDINCFGSCASTHMLERVSHDVANSIQRDTHRLGRFAVGVSRRDEPEDMTLGCSQFVDNVNSSSIIVAELNTVDGDSHLV